MKRFKIRHIKRFLPGYYQNLLHRIAMRDLRHYVKELYETPDELAQDPTNHPVDAL